MVNRSDCQEVCEDCRMKSCALHPDNPIKSESMHEVVSTRALTSDEMLQHYHDLILNNASIEEIDAAHQRLEETGVCGSKISEAYEEAYALIDNVRPTLSAS